MENKKEFTGEESEEVKEKARKEELQTIPLFASMDGGEGEGDENQGEGDDLFSGMDADIHISEEGNKFSAIMENLAPHLTAGQYGALRDTLSPFSKIPDVKNVLYLITGAFNLNQHEKELYKKIQKGKFVRFQNFFRKLVASLISVEPSFSKKIENLGSKTYQEYGEKIDDKYLDYHTLGKLYGVLLPLSSYDIESVHILLLKISYNLMILSVLKDDKKSSKYFWRTFAHMGKNSKDDNTDFGKLVIETSKRGHDFLYKFDKENIVV